MITTHPVAYDLESADHFPLRLTRYQGGDKGPVLVVHGAAVSSGIFTLPTVRENFLQFLLSQGYDVWLFDWRASIIHPVRQFTLDEAARHDMPQAVKTVLSLTKADSLQAVVHCAGSNAFFMAMVQGLLSPVRCVVASQVALHLDVPPISLVKARLGVADVLGRLGVHYMSPSDDDGNRVLQLGFGKLTDAVHYECASTFCHRLTFIYGHLYHHACLSSQTHDRLDTQFGRCNILALRHLSQLVSHGYARRFDYGRKTNLIEYGQTVPPDYLDPTHLKIPITFLSGSTNKTYLPTSTERTFQWLVDSNGPNLYRRHVVDGYGHLDTFMGSNANRDTYPLMLEQLETC
jgi:pimeloyl-ACP methyl ester carboxylesterase